MGQLRAIAVAFAFASCLPLLACSSSSGSPAGGGGAIEGGADVTTMPEASVDGGSGGPFDSGGPPTDGPAQEASLCGYAGTSCCLSSSCEQGLLCGDAGTCLTPGLEGTGATCGNDGDCLSGFCLGPDLQCTTACTKSSDCLPGWTCGNDPQLPVSMVCTCTKSPETCNGKDDDCNGIVDDTTAANADCVKTAGPGHVCQQGACTCLQTCTGQCVDTQSDPANCGACSVACTADASTTAACLGGKCGLVLAKGSQGISNIVSDGTTVFFSDNVVVESVPVGGGPVVTLDSESSIQAMALDATYVYYVIGNGGIFRMPKAGGAQPTLVLGDGTAVTNGVAVDATYLYATRNDGTVMKTLKTGSGTPSVLVPGTLATRAVVDDGTDLYWFSGGPLGSVLGSTPGGTVTTIASGQTFGGLAMGLDSANLYWIAGGENAESLVAAPKMASATVTPLASGIGFALAVASTGTDVYWCDGFRDSISKVPAAGGTPTLVAGEQNGCDWIAVDATNVYWARRGSAGPELVERPQ